MLSDGVSKILDNGNLKKADLVIMHAQDCSCGHWRTRGAIGDVYNFELLEQNMARYQKNIVSLRDAL